MKVFGHRGFSGLYPENTMLAFQKAVEAGADGVEMDIHLSSDGKIVVIHDESLLRTTGVDKLVEDTSFKELISLRASKTKDDKFDATIPSFEEFCAFIKETGILANVEIKTGITWYRDIEKKAVDMIKSFGIEEKIIFSSFNWLSVVRCKELLPACPCGLLYESPVNTRHLAYQAKDLGLQFLHPDFRLLTEEVVKECDDAGIGLNVWTINKEEQMQKLIEWDAMGTISNYPDMCLKMLGR